MLVRLRRLEGWNIILYQIKKQKSEMREQKLLDSSKLAKTEMIQTIIPRPCPTTIKQVRGNWSKTPLRIYYYQIWY